MIQARDVVDAFVGLLTQPFGQDLRTSVTAAGTAVSLAVMVGGSGALVGGLPDALEFAGMSLVVVLVWTVASVVFAKADHPVKLTLARNLSVVSFWVAVTLALMLATAAVTDPLSQTGRRLAVSCFLLILVPIHTLRNLPLRLGMGMTAALLVTTWMLIWRPIILL